MKLKNIEIKAHCKDPERVRSTLKDHEAEFIGVDRQTDIYFKVPDGRLKLRTGNIENNLIYYRRPDEADPKLSDVILHPVGNAGSLKELLTESLGILTTVQKKREIYFIDNVKFHIDRVKGLGNFVEIESIDEEGEIGMDDLRKQCRFYMKILEIKENELISYSYCDLLSDDKSIIF